MNPLSWLGSRATGVLAAGAGLGFLIPNLGGIIQPLLVVLLFIFAVTSFLKVNTRWSRFDLGHSTAPGLLLVWILIGSPIFVAIFMFAFPVPEQMARPFMLWAASPPMTAAIVLSDLLGLDVILATTVCLGGLFIVPLTGPIMTYFLSDLRIDVHPFMFICQVSAFIGFAAAIAWGIRRSMGSNRLRRFDAEINGVTVLVLLIYVATLMSGVRGMVFSNIGIAIKYVAAASLINLSFQAITYFVFARRNLSVATTAALLAGNRNMGVLYAGLGSAVTPEVALFFAATHLPVYVFPYLLRPLYAWAMSCNAESSAFSIRGMAARIRHTQATPHLQRTPR